VAVLGILAGCSKYSGNAESLYLNSHNGPSIEVPPPLTSANIGHFYDLPQEYQSAIVDIEPPGE